MASKNTEYAYEAAMIDSASIGSTSVQVLAENVRRRSAVLVNTGGADVYLAVGRTAVAGKGICLKAGGGSYEVNGGNMTHGAITAITSSGASTLSVFEGS